MAGLSRSESRSSDSGGSPGCSPGRSTSSNRRTYMCKVCGNVFTSGQSLGGHMNVHRKETSSRSSTPPDSQSSTMDHDGSSYKGVRYRKEQHKWVAEIRPPRAIKTWWLGTYSTPEEAAYAYDVAIKYFGSESSLNFEGNQIYHQIPRISTDLQRQEYASELRKVVKKYGKMAMESGNAEPTPPQPQQPEQQEVLGWEDFSHPNLPPFEPIFPEYTTEYTPLDFEMHQAPESSYQAPDFDQADANYGLPGYGYQQHHYNSYWSPRDH